ncbi:response regulator transcription factor [Corticibacter populi]|nr:response regulator transcription factor [Corticibacter populi]
MKTMTGIAIGALDALPDLLRQVGVRVRTCTSRRDLLIECGSPGTAVVILHASMSQSEDIHSLCLHLQASLRLRVVMLGVDDVAARARMLYSGADVCLPGDAGEEEIIATILAMTRRFLQWSAAEASWRACDRPVTHPRPEPALTSGTWELDLDAKLLRAPSGATIVLTPFECCILDITARHAQRLLRHSTWARLKERLLPDDTGHTPLKVSVSRLRSKVRRKTGEELPLRTFHRVGYQLTEPLNVRGTVRLSRLEEASEPAAATVMPER